MIVLDASVVVELLLQTADAHRIEERVLGNAEALHAPHLLDVEVAQVLRRYARRGVLSSPRGAAALRVLDALPLVRHAHAPLLTRLWSLRANLTAYDAAYVALAEALGATLLTRDASLASAPGLAARVEVV
jgi:predicted nucleic acid-binding protein